MLSAHVAQTLARQRHHDLRREADEHRLARTARPAAPSRPPLRVRVGWWLVAAGLRLAVRGRHTQHLGLADPTLPDPA